MKLEIGMKGYYIFHEEISMRYEATVIGFNENVPVVNIKDQYLSREYFEVKEDKGSFYPNLTKDQILDDLFSYIDDMRVVEQLYEAGYRIKGTTEVKEDE